MKFSKNIVFYLPTMLLISGSLFFISCGNEYTTTQNYRVPLYNSGGSTYNIKGDEIGPITAITEATRGDLLKKITIRDAGGDEAIGIVFGPPSKIANNCGPFWYSDRSDFITNPNNSMKFTKTSSGQTTTYVINNTGGECFVSNPWDGKWNFNIVYPGSIDTEPRIEKYIELTFLWEAQ